MEKLLVSLQKLNQIELMLKTKLLNLVQKQLIRK